MPALPTVVTTYLAAIRTSLTQGTDLGSNVRGAALNYLRAQDMATVLELLQDGLDQVVNLTATNGSARSVVDGAATFTAGQQVGNIVIFAGNVTAALAGIEARVVTNSTTELFFADTALPASPAVGDTYTLRGGLLDTQISALREGKGLADAPVDVYGSVHSVMDALVLGIVQVGGSAPTYRQVWSGLTAPTSTTTTVQLNLRGGVVRVDEFRGLRVLVNALEARQVVSSSVTGVLTVAPAYAIAPGNGVATTLEVPDDVLGGSTPKIRTHPGAQPGENAILADLINQLQVIVTAYVLPT